MALPVITGISFDKASYNPGDTITATVTYADNNVHTASYTFSGQVTDNVSGEAGTGSGTFQVATANACTASASGGEPNQVWTKVSDDGHSKAVFTATAV